MTLTQFNRIVEIRTKIISMGTFLSGSIYAGAVTGLWSWDRFLVMLFAVLFVDMGTTGFNSYFDFVSGTDRAELNFERDKVLVHEGVAP
ncbi:MAG TPA: prenyltransferase, partial [Sphaerochaetaceae bacterium]|nr:prenyltransferase [Sphaerochaetaceae bacterium]